MRLSRVACTLGTALFVLHGGLGHSQTPPSSLSILQNVGLPAVEEGVIQGESHVPGSLEALRRAAIRPIGAAVARPGSAASKFLPGRVIVKFRQGTSPTARFSTLSRASRGASMRARLSYANFDIVDIGPNDDVEATARLLRQQADVEYAQPVYRVQSQFVPNDSLYGTLQWNFPLVDIERAWDIQPLAGSTITVAVIDTGVAYMNATVTAIARGFTDDFGNVYPALGTVTIPYSAATQLVGASSRFVSPRDFVWNTATPLDFDGHGTHVAGTLGQLTNDGTGTAGIAFNVKIMPIKVLASTWDVIFGGADGVGGSDDQVARGIRYAVDNGAKIINLSLGSAGPAGSSPVVEDAIRYAVCTGAAAANCSGKGVFVVIAAGNLFQDGNPTSVLAEIAGRVSGAVSVAAVDAARNRAPYSTTGSYIELAAPGGGGLGPGTNGFVWQQTFDFRFVETFLEPPSSYGPPRFDVLAYVGYAGTSQAAPHVAGVAAMLMQQGVTAPAAIEAALERFATDLGSPGRDSSFGFGLVDARNTLRGLGLAR